MQILGYFCGLIAHLGRETVHQAIILAGLDNFLIFPNFLRS